MRQYKDIEDMTKEELEEYLDDVSSGYAFDPDNEILDADKKLPFKEFFEKMNAEVAASQFKSLQEFAAIVSRASRMGEWMYGQLCLLSEHMSSEFKRKIQERMNNDGMEGEY